MIAQENKATKATKIIVKITKIIVRGTVDMAVQIRTFTREKSSQNSEELKLSRRTINCCG